MSILNWVCWVPPRPHVFLRHHMSVFRPCVYSASFVRVFTPPTREHSASARGAHGTRRKGRRSTEHHSFRRGATDANAATEEVCPQALDRRQGPRERARAPGSERWPVIKSGDQYAHQKEGFGRQGEGIGSQGGSAEGSQGQAGSPGDGAKGNQKQGCGSGSSSREEGDRQEAAEPGRHNRS